MELTQEWLRKLSLSRLECGVYDMLDIYPLCAMFYFPWYRHQVEGMTGFRVSSERHRDKQSTIVGSQVFTPNITCMVRAGIEPEWRRANRGVLTTTLLHLWLLIQIKSIKSNLFIHPISQTDSGVFTMKTINIKIKLRQITIIQSLKT